MRVVFDLFLVTVTLFSTGSVLASPAHEFAADCLDHCDTAECDILLQLGYQAARGHVGQSLHQVIGPHPLAVTQALRAYEKIRPIRKKPAQ